MVETGSIRSILDSLRRLVRELRIASRRAQARSGSSAAQLFVLERVAANQPVSVNQLAELTLTHQSSVSVVVHRLVEQGFLEERQSAEDGRRKELTITAGGRKTLRGAPQSVQDRMIAAVGVMTQRDQKDLARLLKMFVDAVGLRDSEPVLFFEKEPRVPEKRRRPKRRSGGADRGESS